MNKLTVIIPAYNVENIIKKTLEKLEKQTFQEFEIILINDGSTDKTLEKIDDYLKGSKLKITLINQKNKGVAEARNQGIKKIRTKYVIFLDSDDFLDNDTLYIMYSEIEKTKSDIICSSYARISLNDKIISKIIYEEKELFGNEIIKQFLLKNISPGIGNALIKTSIIKKNKLTYYKYKYGEDNLFFREILINSQKMKIIKKILFYYVNNPESVMNKKYTESRLDSLKSVQKFIKKYNDYKLTDYINVTLAEEIYGLLKMNYKLIYNLNLPKVKLDIIKQCKNNKIRIILLIFNLPKIIIIFYFKILYYKAILAKFKSN